MPKKQQPFSVTVVTLFPEFIENYAEAFGILQRSIKSKLLKLSAVDLRSFGLGERQVVDDRPFGGGVGMVLRPDVLYKAIKKGRGPKSKKTRVILMTPQGKPFKQAEAKRLASYDKLVLVCGRYEGFDERIRAFVDEEISVGDYVLMGGELPALTVAEAAMRLRPGIIGKLESTDAESFSDPAMLEYPQYTKPLDWVPEKGKRKLSVPKEILTGHHAQVAEWRKTQAEARTRARRSDLLN